MTQSLGLIRYIKQMGGVTALLISTLTISGSADALITPVTVTTATTTRTAADFGQSFVNDPINGTGAIINLNAWAFGIQSDQANVDAALAAILTIRNGVGNTGSIVGTSSTTQSFSPPTGNIVVWAFAGGLKIVDNATYTAVITPSLEYRVNDTNPYGNGTVVVGTTPVSGEDAVFRGAFSAIPVPFEFSPALGVLALGAAFVIKKKLVKKTK